MKIVCGGRGKGKLFVLEKFLECLPENVRRNVKITDAREEIDTSKLKGYKIRSAILETFSDE